MVAGLSSLLGMVESCTATSANVVALRDRCFDLLEVCGAVVETIWYTHVHVMHMSYLLHCRCIFATLQMHICYIADAHLLHCRCMFAELQMHDCYIADAHATVLSQAHALPKGLRRGSDM